MIIKAGIESLCILEKCLSVRLTISEVHPEAMEILRGIKREPLEFSLAPWRDKSGKGKDDGIGEVSFRGIICSINLREKMHFIIHAERAKPLIYEVIEMMDLPVALKFLSARDQALAALIREASQRLSLTEEELIYRESSFLNRNGRQIEGKRSILALSEKQKPIIKNKLERFLRENGEKNGHGNI